MPVHRVALRLASDIPGQPARKWSNTFFLNEATPFVAANVLASAWERFLRQSCTERVFAYEIYATDLVPNTTNYVVVPVAPGVQRGTQPFGNNEPYMPKVCLSVELLVNASRPSRKFWRTGLREVEVTNGVDVSAVTVGAVRSAFNDFLADTATLVDPDGQSVFGVGKIRLTTREFGRESTNLVPTPPPLG